MNVVAADGRHAERLAVLDGLAKDRGIELEHDAPLGPLTTLRVGGVAERFTGRQHGAGERRR